MPPGTTLKRFIDNKIQSKLTRARIRTYTLRKGWGQTNVDSEDKPQGWSRNLHKTDYAGAVRDVIGHYARHVFGAGL